MRRALLLLAGIVLWAAASTFLWLAPSWCFLDTLRGREPGACPDRAVRRTDLEMPEAALRAHVYRPEQAVRATVVVVPGLHPQGIHDPRFQSVARSCAEAGFQVVAPDLVELRNFTVGPGVVDAVAQVVRALAAHLPASSLRSVGVLGVSYAGGPVFVAAARPEVGPRLAFVGAIGGYYELVHAVEYGVSGRHAGRAEAGLPRPHQWPRLIFAAHNADLLVPPADAPTLREGVRLRLQLDVPAAEAREAQLSPAGRALLAGLLDGLGPEDVRRAAEILPRYAALSRELSPASVVGRLPRDLRVYLLHGRDDDVIPYLETLELADALRAAGHRQVRALVTPVFTHVDPTLPEGRWERLRGHAQLVRWTADLLAEARPPVRARE